MYVFIAFYETSGNEINFQNPIADDPMPVTVQDLEGFWMTIDMELKGIMKEFTKVEKYRAANWDPSAVEEEVDVADTTVKTTKPRPLITKKLTPIVSEETKKKLAEQVNLFSCHSWECSRI